MGRNTLLLFALVGAVLAVAGFALKGGAAAGGTKQRVDKEKSLSVTASIAMIDQRQPQQFKTATFALG